MNWWDIVGLVWEWEGWGQEVLGCEIQLIDSLLRHKLPVKVMHIMELIK